MHRHTKPQTLSFSLVQVMNTNTHAHAVIINPGGVRIAFVRSHLILIVGSHLTILQQRRPFFSLNGTRWHNAGPVCDFRLHADVLEAKEV